MIRSSFVLALGATILALACKGREGKPYVLTTTIENNGAGSNLVFGVRADGPYKWNQNYPFRLEITSTEGVEPAKRKFGPSEVGLDGDGKGARVYVPLSGTPTGFWRVRGEVSFSVCTGRVCRVFSGVPITWGPRQLDPPARIQE